MEKTLHEWFWCRAVVVFQAGANALFLSFAVITVRLQRWELEDPGTAQRSIY